MRIVRCVQGSGQDASAAAFISPFARSYTWSKKDAAGLLLRKLRRALWGVVAMHTEIEERSCDLAAFILENKATVRAAAAKFGISKSTVHKDLTERLRRVDPGLYAQVRQLLDWNKAQRHIRGGLATRRKYKGE